MLQLNLFKDSVFYIIERMWCMLFHKHLWEQCNGMERCPKCGQEFDEPSQYDVPEGYK